MAEETNTNPSDLGDNEPAEDTAADNAESVAGQAPAPKGNTKTSATSVALTATFNFSESRKYNFDVTGAASIEATLVSVPAPTGLMEFLQNSSKDNSET